MEQKQGQKIYRWTLKDFSRQSEDKKQSFWHVECECGEKREVDYNKIRIGLSKSCGCYKVDYAKDKFTTHGMTGTQEYRAYINAKSRCNNPGNVSYKHYGGRGIKFKLNSFEEMLEEVGLKPEPHYQLDRTNNEGNYEIGNISWVTPKQNANNKRTSKPKGTSSNG